MSKDCEHSSFKTQSRLKVECMKRCRYEPNEWQVDIAEVMILKLDTVLIAGTGFGKNTSFVLPMMLEPPWEGKRIILIILSLIGLLDEHVSH
jgi:hypothetical protein